MLSACLITYIEKFYKALNKFHSLSNNYEFVYNVLKKFENSDSTPLDIIKFV